MKHKSKVGTVSDKLTIITAAITHLSH